MSDTPEQLRITIMVVEYDIAERRGSLHWAKAQQWPLGGDVRAGDRCELGQCFWKHYPAELDDMRTLERDYGELLRLGDATSEERTRLDQVRRALEEVEL